MEDKAVENGAIILYHFDGSTLKDFGVNSETLHAIGTSSSYKDQRIKLSFLMM